MSDWNTQVINEFRANGGKVEQFGDAPLVILHTIGAKSGALREIPLVAHVDGDAMHVFASKGGATSNPDWAHNLRANPEIDVEYLTETFRANVVELDAAAGDEKLSAQAELMPMFAEYRESAKPRVIPVFRLDRI